MSDATFKDHFSSVALDYARFRPRYPAALFEDLARVSQGRDLAVDIATGNGQAAVGLAKHFSRVMGLDASSSQIGSAESHPRVTYQVAAAESTGLQSRYADLIVVAQALHWFDGSRFYGEARRILRPGGLLAVWCYGHLTTGHSQLDQLVHDFYSNVVGPFWPPERTLVENGYRDIDFPFAELPFPIHAMEAQLTLSELGGYLSTWSATQRFIQANDRNPVPHLLDQLHATWGDPATRRLIQWPIAGRLGRCA